jgi:hypothetical protein
VPGKNFVLGRKLVMPHFSAVEIHAWSRSRLSGRAWQHRQDEAKSKWHGDSSFDA